MVRPLKWERGKGPDEVISFSVNWAADLVTDTISTSAWAFAASNADTALTKANPSIDPTATITTIEFSAGTVGVVYLILNTIVTAGGFTLERTISLLVSSR